MAQAYIENAKKVRERMDKNQKTADMVEAAGGIRTKLTQSDKLGFDWQNYYVNDILVQQVYIEQENHVGTADNPITWVEDVVVITNAFYILDDVRKVWTGETGGTAAWDDERWEAF